MRAAFAIGVSGVLVLKTFVLQFRRARPSQGAGTSADEKERVMLWTVAVILLVLLALGMGTAYTGGGLLHVLLVIAAIVVVIQFLGGRRFV